MLTGGSCSSRPASLSTTLLSESEGRRMATWLSAEDESPLSFGADALVPARVIDSSSLVSCDV